MRSYFFGRSASVLGALVFALALAGAVAAAERSTSRKADAQKTDDAETRDLFDAIAAGEIEVRVIPKDASTGNVLVKNESDRPLNIRLPEALAALPVAAQFGAGVGPRGAFPGGGALPGGNALGLNGGNPSGNQALGVGFPGMMGGGMNAGLNGGGFNGGFNGGFPGGLFLVEPEKVTKLKMTSVCLEYGKDDPNPRIAYELRPIESYTDNAGTIELVKMLGRGEIEQHVAQAAAWHFENGKSWDQLASLVKAVHLNGRRDLFFTVAQVKKAREFAEEAQRRAGDEKSDSLSQSASLADTK